MEGMAALLAGMQRIGAPWMVSGSVGAMYYSEPRATLDVDCIVDLKSIHLRHILSAFPEGDFYVPSETVIAHEIRRGVVGSFNIIHHASGFKADCYPCGDDPLMRWGLSRVNSMSLVGLCVPVAPPEYIVSMKLRFFAMSGQDKHLRDIRSIVRLTPALDRALIGQWASHYGVADAWHIAQFA